MKTRILLLVVAGLVSSCAESPKVAAPDLAMARPAPADMNSAFAGTRIRVDVGTWLVPAGTDFLKTCVPLVTDHPITGTFYEAGWDTYVTPNLHHFGIVPVYNLPCNSKEAVAAEQSYISAAQNGSTSIHLPDGVALRFDNITGIAGTLHLINASTEDVTISGHIDLLSVPRESVKQVAGQFSSQSPWVNVPPHGTQKVTGICRTPVPMKISTFKYHTHGHNKFGGIRLGDANGPTQQWTMVWDQDNLVTMDPPLELAAGQGIYYECNFGNDTDATITYGNDVDQDMCGFMAWYFPSGGDLHCVNMDASPTMAIPYQ